MCERGTHACDLFFNMHWLVAMRPVRGAVTQAWTPTAGINTSAQGPVICIFSYKAAPLIFVRDRRDRRT